MNSTKKKPAGSFSSADVMLEGYNFSTNKLGNCIASTGPNCVVSCESVSRKEDSASRSANSTDDHEDGEEEEDVTRTPATVHTNNSNAYAPPHTAFAVTDIFVSFEPHPMNYTH